MRKLNSQGYTFVELLIAVAILGVMVSGVILARSFMAKQTVSAGDQAYATQKAIQMFEELKGLVNGQEKQGVAVLDNYTDGTSYNTVLTTDKTVDTSPPSSGNAGDALSGNKLTNGHWRYLRQVQINRMANDPNVREVVIKVWLYATDSSPKTPGKLLATEAGLLRTISNVFSPTQVFDVYILALSNVLGWFTKVPSMQSTFSTVLSDMQSRNPGLEVRAHYITQTGFGRDPLYKPFINQDNPTTATGAFPWVYFYPGLTIDQTGGYSGPDTFFDGDQVAKDGNILTDHGGNPSVINSAGFAVCDAFNTDMRYPDELAQYQAVSQLDVDSNSTAPEMTLRMLLEQMASQPTSFENAIIVSMHGEVVPLPNIRNYSDPAKDPGNGLAWTPSTQNMRVVTHPTLIHYPHGSSGVTLRAYAYYDGLESPYSLDTVYPTSVSQSVSIMTVYFSGVTLVSSGANTLQASVSCIYGGINNGVTYNYGITLLPPNTQDPAGMGMSWNVGPVVSGGVTIGSAITLFNTPLRCPLVVPTASPTPSGSGAGGLAVTNRLYNTEYISCPVSTFTNSASLYYPDLTSPVTTIPKNTARWVIMIKNNGTATIGDGQLSVETRLGSDLTTGPTSSNVNEQENLSRTFVWVGGPSGCTPGTSGCGVTPWTERYEFNGDPRDCPYADVKFGSSALGTSDAYVTIDSDSYNWYFKALNTDGFSGFPKTTGGYNGGNPGDWRDMPRYYYLYRTALLNNQALFINLNGYTAWHADQGGEFGSVYDPWSNSLPFIKTPWYPASSTGVIQVNEVQGTASSTSPDGTNVIVTNNGSKPVSTWYSRWWRGEMYPDDAFSMWSTAGNLPITNTSLGVSFYRVPASFVTMFVNANSTNGFDRSRNYSREVGAYACADFLNGSSSSNAFMHTTASGGTTLTNLGLKVYPITNYPMPVSTLAYRPYELNYGGTLSNAFNDSYYTALETHLSIPSPTSDPARVFYNMVSGSYPYALGNMQIDYTPPGGSNKTAFMNISGLQPQGDYTPIELSEIAFSIALRSYFDGGLYAAGTSAHITQLPLIKTWINSANAQYYSPNSISVTISGAVTDVNANPLTNVWFRYPGITSNTGNYYTEEYPNSGLPITTIAGAYNESGVTFLVNLKYSSNNGSNWQFVQDGSNAHAGVLNTNSPYLITSTSIPITYTWDVSNAGQYPAGDYWLRSEVYRQGFPLHYSYHILDLTINR